MCSRVINYYQICTDPEFAHHMIEETGLSERDQEIAWTLRQSRGNTQYYADSVGMPLKTFNEALGNIHRRLMDELFRLALIGWRAEKNRK